MTEPADTCTEGQRASPLFAFLISLVVTGLGQVYAGRDRRGLTFFGASLVALILFFTGLMGRSPSGFLVVALLAFALPLTAAVDAVRQARRPSTRRPWFRRWFVVLPAGMVVSAVLMSVLYEVQVLKSYHIPSASMEPTLEPGDRLMAALDAYRRTPPRPGDLVIVWSPERPGTELIKRVAAVGGDIIEIRDKKVFLNGEPAADPHAVFREPAEAVPSPTIAERRDHLPPLTVPDGYLFLLSDNRDYSFDSRYFGPVSLDAVRAAPLYLFWAADRGRIGTRLAP